MDPRRAGAIVAHTRGLGPRLLSRADRTPTSSSAAVVGSWRRTSPSTRAGSAGTTGTRGEPMSSAPTRKPLGSAPGTLLMADQDLVGQLAEDAGRVPDEGPALGRVVQAPGH